MSNVYDVVVVQEPTLRESEEGVDAKIILGPVTVVAKNKDAASLVALKGKSIEVNSRTEILVRPFA